MISNDILKYVHHLEDRDYLASIIAATTTQELIDAIVALLNSGDHNAVGDTCLFIRDLILVAPRYDIGAAFYDAFYTSAIVDTLEKLVLAENHYIRGHSVYTLGKTYSYRSIPALHDAFHLLRDRDPLLLPRLVGEIYWLEGETSGTMIDTMMSSERYTTRWAALGTLLQFSHNPYAESELLQVKRRCFDQLRFDQNQLVRAEAHFKHQELEFEQLLPTLIKAEKRKQRKELERRRPPISFQTVEIKFGHYYYNETFITTRL